MTTRSPLAANPYTGLAVLGLGAALPTMDIAVNVAFPAITAAFALDTRGIRWVVVYYVVTYACLMLAFGRLGDTIGHRRVFRAGLLVAAVGYVWCALAPDYTQLLTARILQGVSTALLLSCAPALATQLFPEAQRTHALGVHTATTAFAAMLAPLLGGASIAWTGWSGVFWMRVPLIVLALLMLRWLPPDDRERPASDHAGPVLLAAAIACLLLAPSILERPDRVAASLALLLGGSILLAAFVRQQRSSPTPYFSKLRTPPADFALHNVANVLLHFTAFAVPLVVPYYFARIAGYGPQGIGAALALSPIGMLIGSSLAVHAIRRLGTRGSALAAVACLGAGSYAIALGAQAQAQTLVLGALLVNGLGLGLLQVVYADVIVGSLPRAARGVAGSLTMVTRTVGVVLAASALTAALAVMERAHLAAHVDAARAFAAAFAALFTAIALLPALVFVAALLRPALFREPR